MNDDAAQHHERIERDLAGTRVEPELVRGVDDHGGGDEGVEQAVGIEFAGRRHEHDVARLREVEVKVARADIAPHFENTAPEKAHQKPLDQHGGAHEEYHLILGPTGDRLGVLIDDGDRENIDRHPEKLHERPHKKIATKHQRARDRVTGGGGPDFGVV